MKRFYTDVSVTPEHGITLDGKPVRTPARALLTLAGTPMADAVADEWRAQGEPVDPRSMPLTGLANAAIDRVMPEAADFAAGLAAYAESELLCYRADAPPDLVAREEAVWNPLLDWARARFDIGFVIATGIVHKAQPPATLHRLGEAIACLDGWALAAMSPLVTISGSLVIPLALAEGVIDADAAFDAAHLDELWQEEQWGADDLALATRAAHRADFMAAARFLELARMD